MTIQAGLDWLREQRSLPAGWWPDRLVMGLAGSLQTQRREAFLTEIPGRIQTILVTDGQAQLIGASAGKPGCCLAAGTGSVIHWRDASGAFGMAGGWGFPAGDEGSGAWLGLQALQAFTWHRDAQSQATPFTRAVESIIGSSVSDIQQWTTEKRSGRMAKLAPVVLDHADQGDVLATRIRDQGIRWCEKLIALAPDDLPVFLAGSIAERYRTALGQRLPDRLQQTQGDALSGLWLIAEEG